MSAQRRAGAYGYTERMRRARFHFRTSLAEVHLETTGDTVPSDCLGGSMSMAMTRQNYGTSRRWK